MFQNEENYFSILEVGLDRHVSSESRLLAASHSQKVANSTFTDCGPRAQDNPPPWNCFFKCEKIKVPRASFIFQPGVCIYIYIDIHFMYSGGRQSLATVCKNNLFLKGNLSTFTIHLSHG